MSSQYIAKLACSGWKSAACVQNAGSLSPRALRVRQLQQQHIMSPTIYDIWWPNVSDGKVVASSANVNRINWNR